MTTNEISNTQTELLDKRGDYLVATILGSGVLFVLFVARIFTEGAFGLHEAMSFAIPLISVFLLLVSTLLLRNEYKIAKIGEDVKRETGVKVFLIVGYVASAFAVVSVLISFI